MKAGLLNQKLNQYGNKLPIKLKFKDSSPLYKLIFFSY
jgi:hypothetical protein